MHPQQPSETPSESPLFKQVSYIVLAPLAGGMIYASAAIGQGRYGDALLIVLASAGIAIILGLAYSVIYWLLKHPCLRGCFFSPLFSDPSPAGPSAFH